MATDNTATATPESPETFDGLMIRFESAAYRLRLAVRDIEQSEGLGQMARPARARFFRVGRGHRGFGKASR
jgi:hypothetical protein